MSELTAKLETDFTDFYDACKQAEVSLKSFESETGNVTSSLNKMIDQFDGRRVIEQATLMTEALGRIGADHMTEQELQRIGNTAKEAVDKMTAMGIDVPPQIRKAAEAAKDVSGAHVDLIGVLSQVAGAFGIAFSVSAAVNFIRTLGDEAVALKNLSLQTRIGIEDLQVLEGATSDFGVTGDEVGKALAGLSRRIAGNDESVAFAYHLMGMSIDEVKGKDPMTLFVTTERALAGLKGQIQDTAAADLYGPKLGPSMIALSSGIDDALDHAKNFNTIIGSDSVKATADFANAIETAWKSIKASVTDTLGPLAEGFNNMNKLVEGGTSKWAIFWAQLKDQVAFEALGKGTENMTRLFLNLQKQQEDNAKAQAGHTDTVKAGTAALDEHGRAASFMAKLEGDAAKPLLDWQVEYLDHLASIGKLNAQNAIGIGVNADQLDAYKAKVEQLKKDEADRAKDNKEFDQQLMASLNNQLGVMKEVEAQQAQHYGLDEQIKMLDALRAAEHLRALAVADEMTTEQDRQRVLDDDHKRDTEFALQRAALEQTLANQHGEAMIRAINFQTQYNALFGRDAQGNIVGVNTVLDDHRKKLDAINAAIPDAVEGTAEYTEKINALKLADQQLVIALNDEAAALNKAAIMRSILNAEAQTSVKTWNDGTYAAQQHNKAVADYNSQLAGLNKTLSDTAAGSNADAIAWANAYAKLKDLTAAVNESRITLQNSIGAWRAQDEALNHYQGTLAATTNEVLKFNAAIALGPNTGQYGTASQFGTPMAVANMGTTYAWANAILSGGQVPVGTAGLLPQRASGGSVASGSAYVVGEHGPELFVPSASGVINPNAPRGGGGGGGGGTTMVVNVYGSMLSTKTELAQLVQEAFVSTYRRGGYRLPV